MKNVMTPREKNMVFVGVALLVCILFTIYFIMPLWSTQQNSKIELTNISSKLLRLQNVQRTASFEKDIEKMKSELNQLRKQIPVNPESAELLYYLNQAAEKTGVILTDFGMSKASNKTQQPELLPMNASVSVIGFYSQISQFIGKTEELSRMTHNKTVRINELTDQKKLECIIEFETYVAGYGIREFKNESDIPKASTLKPIPFRF
jgi:Tfp pilus assembly protein PilO